MQQTRQSAARTALLDLTATGVDDRARDTHQETTKVLSTKPATVDPVSSSFFFFQAGTPSPSPPEPAPGEEKRGRGVWKLPKLLACVTWTGLEGGGRKEGRRKEEVEVRRRRRV